MNTKQTVLLLILAVGLVAAAMWYGQREEEMIASAAAPTDTILDGVTSSTIEKIEILAPEESPVTLTRGDDQWYVDADKKHRADKNAISSIFTPLEKEISGEVVSEKTENHSDYLVDETSGTHVKLYGKDNQTVADFYVGKDGPAAFNTYMRKAGDDKVINANASLSHAFKRPDGWRDKAIFELTQDQIGALSAEGTSATFELKKVAGTWELTKPEQRKAEAGKVSTMLSMLSMLRTNSFPETTAPLAELGLDPPRQKYTVTYEDRKTSPPEQKSGILLIGDKKDDTTDYYAKRTDNDSLYLISEYIVKALAPELKDLAPPPPPPPSEETTSTDSLTTESASSDTTSTESAATESETTEDTPTAVVDSSEETTGTVTATETSTEKVDTATTDSTAAPANTAASPADNAAVQPADTPANDSGSTEGVSVETTASVSQ